LPRRWRRWRRPSSAESLRILAPATSANLGPGFDALALALDLTNEVVVTRRDGPLDVHVSGEGAGELPEDGTNLICRAMEVGLDSLDGLGISCTNAIPLGRGLGSSAATVCAGLVAANAIGVLRWSPDDLLRHAIEFEGHADNAGACIYGGIVAVGPGARAFQLPLPEELLFVTVVPEQRVSTDDARGALPVQVPHADAADTVARAIGLTLALERGELDGLPELLVDRLHEPYRAGLIPGLDALRSICGKDGCLGVTISGSGPTVLLWARRADAARVADTAKAVMAAADVPATVSVVRALPGGIRARWVEGPETRLAKAVG
jgi:homoserine kinase